MPTAEQHSPSWGGLRSHGRPALSPRFLSPGGAGRLIPFTIDSTMSLLFSSGKILWTGRAEESHQRPPVLPRLWKPHSASEPLLDDAEGSLLIMVLGQWEAPGVGLLQDLHILLAVLSQLLKPGGENGLWQCPHLPWHHRALVARKVPPPVAILPSLPAHTTPADKCHVHWPADSLGRLCNVPQVSELLGVIHAHLGGREEEGFCIPLASRHGWPQRSRAPWAATAAPTPDPPDPALPRHVGAGFSKPRGIAPLLSVPLQPGGFFSSRKPRFSPNSASIYAKI